MQLLLKIFFLPLVGLFFFPNALQPLQAIQNYRELSSFTRNDKEVSKFVICLPNKKQSRAQTFFRNHYGKIITGTVVSATLLIMGGTIITLNNSNKKLEQQLQANSLTAQANESKALKEGIKNFQNAYVTYRTTVDNKRTLVEKNALKLKISTFEIFQNSPYGSDSYPGMGEAFKAHKDAKQKYLDSYGSLVSLVDC